MEINWRKNNLDIFRIIATVQVFLGHFISHFTFPKEPPFAIVYFVRGVPILFALCVFFAAMSFERIKELRGSYKEYYLGRFYRIVPEFYLCICLNTIIIFFLYKNRPSVMEGIIYGITQFCGMNFYTGEWLRGYGVGTPNGVLWTIPVQIQFFILVPILSCILRKLSLRKSVLFVLMLAFISIGLMRICLLLPEIVGKLVGVTVFPYLYFLVGGMVFYIWRETLIPWVKRFRYVILLMYLFWRIVEEFACFPHIFDGVLYNIVTTSLLTTLIFAFGFISDYHMKLDLTYGFYLYHMVFINIVIHCFGYNLESWSSVVINVICIVMFTLAFALLSKKLLGDRFYIRKHICPH